jgi:hypothetical protein
MQATQPTIKVVPAGAAARDGSDGYRVECSCGYPFHEAKPLRLRVAEEVATAHKWADHGGKALVT